MSAIIGIPPEAFTEWERLHEAADGRLTPCRASTTEDWFDGTPARQKRAAELCGKCPVLNACLAYALAAGEKWGVWGGKTPAERASMAVGR